MKEIKYVCGDLFKDVDNSPIIVPHVVNCHGAFSAGFVIPLGKNYPEAKKQYLEWTDIKLGETLFVSITPELCIAHMCAQTLGGYRPLYYHHLANCLSAVGEYAKKHEMKILAPAFGSGLAMGSWNVIEPLIYDCWIREYDLNTTIYYLPGTLER
jgi:hypothetical protein